MSENIIPDKHPGIDTFRFGDSRDMCDALIQLVRSGRKTATCSALRDHEVSGEKIPCVGLREIAVSWGGTPELLIETTEVMVLRFCDVGAGFALAEGENSTLQGWQRDHQAFFERNGGFTPDMKLVCERFRVVEDLGG